jgi:hypothetical protein
MEEILRGYRVDEATWFYLSLLLIIAVFFRFSRVFSLRNADLAILLSIAPGILLVRHGFELPGYGWLFGVSGVLLVRLIADGYFTRRPRLEQNLNAQGLLFLCVSASAFLAATAWNADRIPDSTVVSVEAGDRLLNRQEAPPGPVHPPQAPSEDAKAGPAVAVLTAPLVKLTQEAKEVVPVAAHSRRAATRDYVEDAARLASIVAHLIVVLALLMVGRWHFGDQQIGLAMATLYLLLPCTSYDVGRLNHVLPSAFILWAIAAYRIPAVAGALMGMACGTLFFPIFLLPLWLAFYDRRGAVYFLSALAVVGSVLAASFVLTAADTRAFVSQMIGSVDWSVLAFHDNDGGGFWRPELSAYRIPVFVAFCVIVVMLTYWPRHKTLEQLVAHSTAIIVGTQFWYPLQDGVYTLWYLPLLLVVVFRPSLTHLLPPDRSSREARQQANDVAASRELTASAASGAGNGARLR